MTPTSTAASVELGPGSVVVIDGAEWIVEQTAPQFGRVVLVAANGNHRQVNVGYLIHHADGWQSAHPAASDPLPAGRGRQLPTLDDLTGHQRELVTLRLAHLLEVETGFRGGDPLRPAPGEPRPGYDPAVTTVTHRRRTKVAELVALDPDQARLLGLDRVGYRTLMRWAIRHRQLGPIGCADDRWLRPSSGHPSVTEIVREAIHAVHAESLHRSRMSLRAKERLIHQYIRERHGTDATALIPGYYTLRVIWREWFGPNGGRQRYVRSAAKPTSGDHVVVHRPGQVVALDTTILPVKVRETMFGDPVSVHLTLALDVYTHSLVAFRLTLVSDSAVDVAMLLRDITMPLPMRPDWGQDLEWPYPGLPATVVAEFAGHRVAGLPFFTPETITTDHGSVYRNHHLVEVQRVLGANILPARVLRPTDKQVIERAFGAVRSLLFEHLLGYTGVDVYDRGADPEADAVLTIDAMEHLIATWTVAIWQNRRLGEHAPSWDPGGAHSPNTLFAAAMAQGGFAMEIPAPELYYQLLPAHHVVIHDERGVKIRGLWYNGPALDPYRATPSPRGGRHKRKWVLRRDPRDARTVFFHDPHTHAWHTLRWTGLPPEGEIPPFSDTRTQDLLVTARQAGLKPRTDAELLPLLLDLLDKHVPVASWPTANKATNKTSEPSPGKAQRTELARDEAQGRAAAADRATARPLRPVAEQPALHQPAPASSPTPSTGNENEGGWQPSWPEYARSVNDAVDSDRRRRREDALGDAPVLRPARLGDAFRRGNLFLLATGDTRRDTADDADTTTESDAIERGDGLDGMS